MSKIVLIGIGAPLLAIVVFMQAVSWFVKGDDAAQAQPAFAQSPEQVRGQQVQALVNRAEAHLVDHIKAQMHDPDSFEISSENVTDRGSYVILNMHFRGKNPLGATVLSQGVIAVSMEGKLLSLELRQ